MNAHHPFCVDNTLRRCALSSDGAHFYPIVADFSNTAFLTADELGVFASGYGSNDIDLQVVSIAYL